MTAAEPAAGAAVELRLALVCYGGVSLAVYMHGLTREILELVAASRDAVEGVAAADATPSHYHAALQRARDENHGVPVRVVVDIIAGTSAGGINGICLAAALAHDSSLLPLRRLWLEEADITRLMAGFGPWRLRVAEWALRSLPRLLGGDAAPPLQGDRMFRLAHRALADMRATSHGGSLVPVGQALDLAVTTTDFRGRTRWFPIARPAEVFDREHRRILPFRRSGDGGTDDLTDAAALAFAVRATSSFPGAFAPVALRDIGRLAGDDWDETRRRSFERRVFRDYELAGEDVGDAWFVDGGVLDNHPFERAIELIVARPAAHEVRRCLVYLEPDPAVAAAPASSPGRPGLLETVVGSIAGIPRDQPIVDQLDRVAAFNVRVDRLATVIARSEDRVAQIVRQVEAAAGDAPTSDRWRELMHDAARHSGVPARPDAAGGAGGDGDLAYRVYVRMKLVRVVEGLAAVLNGLCEYPDGTVQNALVRAVVRAWADARGLTVDAAGDDPLTPGQVAFLRSFDLAYGRRLIRFVVQAVNDLYGDDDAPTRAQLDSTKAMLYAFSDRLLRATEAASLGGAVATALALLGEEALAPVVARLHAEAAPPLPDVATALVAEHRAGLDALHDEVATALDAALDGFGTALDRALTQAVGEWESARARRRVLDRQRGFPVWDSLIFPLVTVGDVGELQRIEVVRMSPLDATVLRVIGGGPKLRSLGMAHFGGFFDRSARENDYLWGRLDAVEQLIRLLLPGVAAETVTSLCRAALAQVIAAEGDLRTTAALRSSLLGQLS